MYIYIYINNNNTRVYIGGWRCIWMYLFTYYTLHITQKTTFFIYINRLSVYLKKYT